MHSADDWLYLVVNLTVGWIQEFGMMSAGMTQSGWITIRLFSLSLGHQRAHISYFSFSCG